MTEKLNMEDVLAMRSSGYYSQRTAGAKNAIDSVLPLMKEAIKSLPQTEFLRFADFGALGRTYLRLEERRKYRAY